MEYPNIRIVLVEPQGALNIGSVSRVMMNFGFSDLRIVSPRVDHLSKQATDMAVSAKDTILKDALLCDSLQEALDGCHYVIGTSTRQGKYRREVLESEELATMHSKIDRDQHMAIVFGPEDHGLSTADLNLCNIFVTIRTSEALHSINLAQAVTICLYELSKEKECEAEQTVRKNAPFEEFESMITHMTSALDKMNYLNPQNPEHIIHTYRRIFSRANLDAREVLILHGLWSRIDYLSKQVVK